MKKLIIVCFYILFSSFGFSQTQCIKIDKADSLFNSNHYKSAFKYYRSSLKSNCRYSKYCYFKAAKSAFITGRKRRGYSYLNQLLNSDWANLELIMSDSILKNEASDKRFICFVGRVQDTIGFYLVAKNTLLEVYEDDQMVRKDSEAIVIKYNLPLSMDRMHLFQFIDSINQVKVEKILSTFGWVSDDIVGYKANRAIFLTIQHSNIENMKNKLPLLLKSVEKGNSESICYALLFDRVNVNDNKCQIFGTQYTRDKNGDQVLFPICNIEEVDIKRKELGLSTLEEHMKKNNLRFNPIDK